MISGGRPDLDHIVFDYAPPGFIELMTSCWDPNPRARPSAASVLSELTGYLGDTAHHEDSSAASSLTPNSLEVSVSLGPDKQDWTRGSALGGYVY